MLSIGSYYGLLRGYFASYMQVKTYLEAKTGNVFLSITYRGKRFYLSTGLKSDKKFAGTDIPGSSAKRHRLRQIVNDCEDYLDMHPTEATKEMQKHLKSLITGASMDEDKLSSLVGQYGNLRTSEGTKKLYLLTAKRIEDYDSHAAIGEINHQWLDGFYKHERKRGRMVNGIAIDLRNMRAAMNWAIDNGITDNYPFRRYYVKTEETRKRDMSDEQLAALKAHQGSVYVDVLLLLIYLRGINISDLLMAEPSQIRCGRLEYRRNKTGQLFSVKIEPEAQTIIDKYKGNEHLLYILDSSKDYHTFLRNMNRRVKKYVPGISSYWSRHTVASIASRLDIPTDVIGRLLGHADPVHSTTNIYINFDISKVDRAMRKVIDYINEI